MAIALFGLLRFSSVLCAERAGQPTLEQILQRLETNLHHYSLQPIRKNRPTEPYVIHFVTDDSPRNPEKCLLQENSRGRAFIDPASMQIKHLDLTTPGHVIAPGDYSTPPLMGKRVLSVDYAPVLLGGEAFWMPSAISMRTTSGSGTFHMTVWSFRATYRNYHKLEVTSRIVPGSESRVP